MDKIVFIKKPILVVKYGGTSVGDCKRLEFIAQHLFELSKKYSLVVIVSAMAGVTNQLVSYCDKMAPSVRDAEVDVVLSAGEQITSGLLALKLKNSGLKSASVLGWQLNFLTTLAPTQARIKNIDADILLDYIKNETIPIIAGFQGINSLGRITTLGRGGSDTSAVAVAAALQKNLISRGQPCPIECHIYTDVDGIYTADPRFVKKAKKMEMIPAPYMLEMSQSGSKVLHPRAVQLALRHNVCVRVLSSFSEDQNQTGTLICTKKEKNVENSCIYGIAHHQNDYMISIKSSRKAVQKIIADCAELDINTDLLTLGEKDNQATMTTMILNRHAHILENHLKSYTDIDYKVFTNKVKIALIGVGLQNDLSTLKTIYRCLDKLSIMIDMLHVSELKISFVVDQTHTIKLLEVLHENLLPS